MSVACVAPYHLAASVEDQDRELEDMRRELEEVSEAIAGERAAQDQVIRSFRENSTHLHRLRDESNSGGVASGRRGTLGGVGEASFVASIDDMSEPPTPPAARRGRGRKYAANHEHPSLLGGTLREAKVGGGGGGAWGYSGGGPRGGGAAWARDNGQRVMDRPGSREQAGNRGGGVAHPRFGNARRPMY